MITLQAYRAAAAQRQPNATPSARWKRLLHASVLRLSLSAHAGQGAQPAPRLVTVCRSLDGLQVLANVCNGHPVADWCNNRFGAVRVCHAHDLNFSSFHAGCKATVIKAATRGIGCGLDFKDCLHGVSPMDALNIEHLARFNNTVRRKVEVA